MKPLTMSEEDERYVRECAAKGLPALGHSLGASWSVTVAAAYREVDALRARLAAAERELEATRAEVGEQVKLGREWMERAQGAEAKIAAAEAVVAAVRLIASDCICGEEVYFHYGCPACKATDALDAYDDATDPSALCNLPGDDAERTP